MDAAQFDDVRRYVGFTDATSAVLRSFHPIAAPHYEPIVDDFYDAIEAHPAARRAITGGRPQIDRLKRTLVAWLESVLTGPHDLAFLEAHARIGRVHVRISLPQEFMFTAMNRIRSRLLEIAHRAYPDSARFLDILQAVNQVLDLELAIMLDTYREDWTDRVRSAERLATIGQLAASVGHELRNPLGIIQSSLYLVQQRLKKLAIVDPQLTKHHDKINLQIRHCGKTIDNLLDLARDRPPDRHRFPLRGLVQHALEFAPLAPQVEVNIDVPEHLTIDADPDDLTHVVSNLLTNAAQAQDGAGRIWIEASPERGGVALRVRDEGPGIPLDIRHKIFEALFTTKARGTGLGLALCRRIMYAHGGEIALESSERGASFRVWIPDLEDASRAQIE
jgi:signal transduction histidine kinase